MAITVQQISTAASANTVTTLATTFTSPVTTGNGIVVCAGHSKVISSVTDTASNTYVQAASNNFFSGNYSSIWYCANATGGFTTATVHLTSGNIAAIAFEVLGVLTLKESNSAFQNSTSHTPGAITTTTTPNAHRVIMAASCAAQALTTPGAPFTDAYNTGTGFNTDIIYQIVTAVQTALNPAFTTGASTGGSAAIASFSSSITAPPVAAGSAHWGLAV